MNLDNHGPEEKLLARPFSVKTTDDVGSFEGHGAIFNDLHPTSSWALDMDWKDRVMPGALMKTLAEHARAGTIPPMLYMHERGNVVGAWRDMGEVGVGLHVAGQVAMSARTPAGTGLHELLKMGAITGLSMGFRVRKATMDQDKKIREIEDIELNELSIVDVPGINRARITDVKSGARNIETLERALRDAGLSRREAKALLAEGFGALRDVAAPNDDSSQRDAGGDGGSKDDFLASVKRLAAAMHP